MKGREPEGKQRNLVLRVSGPEDRLGIFINGLFCEKITPAEVEVKTNDIVYTGWLNMGLWVVQGTEKWIAFERESFQAGSRIYIDTGYGRELIGYHLAPDVSQDEFDELVRQTKPLRLLYIGWSVKIRSVGVLANRTDLWALSLHRTRVEDICILASLKSLRVLDLTESGADAGVVASLKESLPECTIYSDTAAK
ncbi:MAG TPA: hypothetical protein ENF73_07060 [Proteobacteria bacterium]|nr:hypothetical protein [Pseudomonadota bacterium]